MLYLTKYSETLSKSEEIILSVSEDVFSELRLMFVNLWSMLRDYRFIVFGVLVLLLICLIILWARKHMPSKGRITDIYDYTGERYNKKSNNKGNQQESLKDLPKEFYKKK